MRAMKKIFFKALTTEMRCNGSKPCQGHIKRQHSGKEVVENCYKRQHRSLSAHCNHSCPQPGKKLKVISYNGEMHVYIQYIQYLK